MFELWHLHAFMPRCTSAEFSHVSLPTLMIRDEASRVPRVSITSEPENAERLRLAAAALNGDLRDLLDDLYEFCDDLGDVAPDSPPYAHRALNLAARLDDLLPKPAKTKEPA